MCRYIYMCECVYIYLDLGFNQGSHIAFTCPISLGFFGIPASFYLL